MLIHGEPEWMSFPEMNIIMEKLIIKCIFAVENQSDANMRELIRMIFLTCLILACTGNAVAQEPVAPPFTEPAEKWLLTYDDYRVVEGPSDCYTNFTREVRIVRDGDNIYVQGIFPSYSESWTLATVSGNELQFEKKQILQIVDGVPMYFRKGTAEFDFYSGSSLVEYDINFYPDDWIYVPTSIITISDDGTTITVNKNEDGNPGVFWYDEKSEGMMHFAYGYRREDQYDGQVITVPFGEEFPDKDYMVNMDFERWRVVGLKTSELRLTVMRLSRCMTSRVAKSIPRLPVPACTFATAKRL